MFLSKCDIASEERSLAARTILRVTRESILKTNHCTIGSWLAKAWHFPDWLQRSILYHEDPGLCPETRIVIEITFLANLLAHNFGFPSPGNEAKGTMAIPALAEIGCEEEEEE